MLKKILLTALFLCYSTTLLAHDFEEGFIELHPPGKYVPGFYIGAQVSADKLTTSIETDRSTLFDLGIRNTADVSYDMNDKGIGGGVFLGHGYAYFSVLYLGLELYYMSSQAVIHDSFIDEATSATVDFTVQIKRSKGADLLIGTPILNRYLIYARLGLGASDPAYLRTTETNTHQLKDDYIFSGLTERVGVGFQATIADNTDIRIEATRTNYDLSEGNLIDLIFDPLFSNKHLLPEVKATSFSIAVIRRFT